MRQPCLAFVCLTLCAACGTKGSLTLPPGPPPTPLLGNKTAPNVSPAAPAAPASSTTSTAPKTP